MITIRYETFSDISSVSFVHAETWHSTYQGIISDDYLNRMIENQVNRIQKRQETFYDHKISRTIVAEIDGKVIGFSSYGPSRDFNDKKIAEIYALYVLKEKQGIGIGNLMVEFIVDEFINDNYDSLRIWALKENKYRKYYEKLGGKIVEEKEIVIGMQNYLEVCYQYDHLKDLQSILRLKKLKKR